MKFKCRMVSQGQPSEGVSQRGNSWRKKNYIVETIEQYPKKVCLSVWNDHIEEFDRIKGGEEIAVEISLSSREYNGRWYTEVLAESYDHDILTASIPANNPQQQQQQQVRQPYQQAPQTYQQAYQQTSQAYQPQKANSFSDSQDLPF